MVLVIGDALLDLAAQAVDREVHARQLDGFTFLFLAGDKHAGVFAAGFIFLAVFFNKLR